MKRRGHRRRTWGRAVLGIGSVALVGVAVSLWWTAAGWDAIERVDVSGASRLTSDQVRAWADVPRGASLWTLDPHPIVARLERRPWLKTVTIHKRFPHTIAIDVTERVPIAIVVPDPGTPRRAPMWIDDEGVMLDVARSDRGFPLVHSAPVNRPEGLAAAGKVLSAFRALNTSLFPLDALVVDVASPEDLTVLLPNGTRVRFGRGDYVEKWRQYVRIHSDVARRVSGTRIVDLRFQDRAVVTGG